MGPRGGGGFGFLHVIAGMVGLALFVAFMVGLLALALGIARKKGWGPRWKPGPGPGHGPHHEPGAPPHGSPGPWEAQRILDERLARGEIEIDDYHARRNALDGAVGVDADDFRRHHAHCARYQRNRACVHLRQTQQALNVAEEQSSERAGRLPQLTGGPLRSSQRFAVWCQGNGLLCKPHEVGLQL